MATIVGQRYFTRAGNFHEIIDTLGRHMYFRNGFQINHALYVDELREALAKEPSDPTTPHRFRPQPRTKED